MKCRAAAVFEPSDFCIRQGISAMSVQKPPLDEQPLHGEARAELEAPKVPLVLDPDDPAGLLPLKALGQDLEVTFMDWDFTVIPGRTDLVQLGFTPFFSPVFVPVAQRSYPTPIAIDLPQTLSVSKDLLDSGVYRVSIRVVPSMQEDNATESPSKKLPSTPPNPIMAILLTQ